MNSHDPGGVDLQILNRMLNAPKWQEVRAIIQAHPELLNGGAEKLLQHHLRKATEKQAIDRLSEILTILRRCREQGMEAAFADRILPNRLREILAIMRKNRSNLSLVQQLELLEEGLDLAPRQQNPRIWVILMVYWTNLLVMTPSELVVARREQALEDYAQIMKILEKEQMWLEWAKIAKSRAILYRDRLIGDVSDNQQKAEEFFLKAANVYSIINRIDQAGILLDLYELNLNWAGDQKTARATNATRYLEQATQILLSSKTDFNEQRLSLLYVLGKKWENCPIGGIAKNVEKAIGIHEFQRKKLKGNSGVHGWAHARAGLASALLNRRIGDRRTNIEKAIRYFKSASRSLYRNGNIVDCALTLSNLSTAWLERLVGSPLKNLKEAVKATDQGLELLEGRDSTYAIILLDSVIAYTRLGEYEPEQAFQEAERRGHLALEIFHKAIFPVEWAMTHICLGNVYLSNKNGNRQLNLTRAIDYFEQAKTYFEEHGHQGEFAKTLINLALCYSEQRSVNRAENQEKAITYHQQASKILSQEGMPVEWGRNVNNLGALLLERVTGDESENVERAIVCFQHALPLRDVNLNPEAWAETMENLGTAYSKRIRGDLKKNSEQAIQYYLEVLKVRKSSQTPLLWAETQQKLGNVYRLRKLGLPRNNYEQALFHCRQALRIHKRARYPHKWAQTMTHLANIYSFRDKGNKAANLKTAIRYYREAMEVRTREQLPVGWAEIMVNLGNACLFLHTARPGSLLEAIEAYENALAVYTGEDFPEDFIKTRINLGKAHFLRQSWPAALVEFQEAYATLERRYTQNISLEFRREEPEIYSELPVYMAFCLLRLNRIHEALTLLEQTRARIFADRVYREKAVAEFQDQAHLSQLQAKLKELDSIARTAENSSIFVQTLEKLRQARRQFEVSVDEFRRGTGVGGQSLDLPGILDLVQRLGRPLIFLGHTPLGGFSLMVLPHTSQLVVDWFDKCTEPVVLGWLFDDPFQKNHLHLAAEGPIAELNHNLKELLPRLEGSLMAQLCYRLAECGYQQAVLLPCGLLGQLPLAAAVPDHFTFSFVPSCQALTYALEKLEERDRRVHHFLAVVRPLPDAQDLQFAGQELPTIRECLEVDHLTILEGKAASLEQCVKATPGHSIVHFSCHGFFDLNRPLDSALRLAGGDMLTMRDILENIPDMSSIRLAVLGACQTGSTNFEMGLNEEMGFPTAFLQTGVSGVVSTRWQVDDASAKHFFIAFFRAFLLEKCPPAIAVRKAQLWLKNDATVKTLGLYEEAATRWRESGEQDDHAYQLMRSYQNSPDARPYADPYHWAGYVFMGV